MHTNWLDLFMQLGSSGLGSAIGLLLVAFLLRSYLPSYLGEKGKNLATREDIGKITDQIEGVKATYQKELLRLGQENSLLLEQIRGRSQLRTAAVERRLQAHQDAYRIWKGVLEAANTDKDLEATNAAYGWWNGNCLYLSEGSRHAFLEKLHAASHHHYLVADRSDPAAARQNYACIRAAGAAITAAASLPSLGDKEFLSPGMGATPLASAS